MCRFSTVTRPPPADTRELAGAVCRLRCVVSPRSPRRIRESSVCRLRRFSTVTRPPPADTRELAGALCAAYDTSFLHSHLSTSGGYESSLEPCVPPTTRRFSTVTRPPPSDTRELAGAQCTAYNASFLHGHPSTSSGYERARWSPVYRLRRVVSPRSPVHLQRIRESSLEPSVPPTTRRFSTVTRPPPADTRELEPSAACDQTTPARHWGRWKIPESPCLPRTLWIRNVLVTPESTSATLQTRHCTMQWENLGPPWRGDQRLPCLPSVSAARLREFIFRTILATPLSQDDNCVVEKKASKAGISYFHTVFHRMSQDQYHCVVQQLTRVFITNQTQTADWSCRVALVTLLGVHHHLGLVRDEKPCQLQHNTMILVLSQIERHDHRHSQKPLIIIVFLDSYIYPIVSPSSHVMSTYTSLSHHAPL